MESDFKSTASHANALINALGVPVYESKPGNKNTTGHADAGADGAGGAGTESASASSSKTNSARPSRSPSGPTSGHSNPRSGERRKSKPRIPNPLDFG